MTAHLQVNEDYDEVEDEDGHEDEDEDGHEDEAHLRVRIQRWQGIGVAGVRNASSNIWKTSRN